MNAAQQWVLQGDCLETLRAMPDACIDSVVTDPPYGLSKEPDMAEVVRHWCAAELGTHAYRIAREWYGEQLRSHAAAELSGWWPSLDAAQLGAMVDRLLPLPMLGRLAAAMFPITSYSHTGGGFMGKTWDSFVPGPEVWREVLRVLKPGGHALVFSGTRTYDLTVLAMRIAGFEIRDQLAWMYGSGFPKSLDVSKAIDASDAATVRRDRQLRFTEWARSTGLTAGTINAATGTCMGSHYVTDKEQPCVATREHFEKLRPFFGTAPAWVEQLVDERTVESENMKRREVIGTRSVPDGRPGFAGPIYNDGEQSAQTDVAITRPYSPGAAAWSGWGTALKPAQEPIVLARKPLIGTVAANVLAHGTGGINVDACRIDGAAVCAIDPTTGAPIVRDGRWPANVLLDETAAEVLDRQTGPVAGQQSGTTGNEPSDRTASVYARGTARKPTTPRGDTGGASRFYYVAKTGRAEREAGLDHLPVRTGGELTDREDDSDGLNSPRAGAGRKGGRRNVHPTVKPIALMRHLVRLITPPGGIVLDPYCGSGSTLCAAVLEGFRGIGCELTEEYVPIIEGRIAYWSTQAPAANDGTEEAAQ